MPADLVVLESADWQAAVEHLGGGDGPKGRVLMHTNQQSCVPATVARQGLPAGSALDLLRGRTFGLFATCSDIQTYLKELVAYDARLRGSR